MPMPHTCHRSLAGAAIPVLSLAAMLTTQAHGAAGIKVLSALSGDLPFSATVVTNITIEGEGWIEPSAVTNYVDLSLVRARTEVLAEVDSRGYLTEHQSLQPATDYADQVVSNLNTEISSRGYLTEHQSLQPAKDYADLAVSNLNEDVSSRGYLTEHQSLHPVTNYVNLALISATNALDQAISARGYMTEASATAVIGQIVEQQAGTAVETAIESEGLLKFDDESQADNGKALHVGEFHASAVQISGGAVIQGGLYVENEPQDASEKKYYKLFVDENGQLAVRGLVETPVITGP